MKLLVLLAVLFIAFPILEFTILIEIGRRLGTVTTILIVFGTGILGAILARMEGMRIVSRIQDNLRLGIMPQEELLDGFLVLIAGVMLITPGLISDITGMLLLFPLTRFPVKMLLKRLARRAIATRTFHINVNTLPR